MNTSHPTKGHELLGHSYLVYIAGLVVALLLEFLMHIQVSIKFFAPLGVLLIVLGTLLAFWAQRSSLGISRTKKEHGEIDTTHFSRGPYAFLKWPTQMGLLLMFVGLGCVLNSVTIIIFSFIAFFISRQTFMRRHEKYLVEKYGDVYDSYRRRMPF